MKWSGLYALTDEQLPSDAGLAEAVRIALDNGISLLQYRNKSGNTDLQRRQIESLLPLCRQYSVPLIINDSIDLCLATGADGVHLGQDDCPLTEARGRLGDDVIIGITCHQSLSLARAAQTNGANYVAFGRFFPSSTKPDAPAADLSILTRARAELAVPVVAIGGVNAENGASLLAAGANMLAVAGGIFSGPDIAGNTRRLATLFTQQQDSP